MQNSISQFDNDDTNVLDFICGDVTSEKIVIK